MTRYEPLRESFSTADADYPKIVSDRGNLQVSFRDWQENRVILQFHEVVAFSWDEGDASLELEHRDDTCYVVYDSPWLARHRAVGSVLSSDDCQHFKLCFNAAGVLQVLAARLEFHFETVE